MQLKLTHVRGIATAFALANLGLVVAAPGAAAPTPSAKEVGPAAASPDAAQADGHLFVCTDANFDGECSNLGFTNNVCTDMPTAFDDNISSWGPDAGFICITWTDPGCGGATYVGGNPGFSVLPPEIDNAISSFECFAC